MLVKVKQYYKNMSIGRKMTVIFVGIIVFFITLVLVVSDVLLYHSNIGRIEQSIQDECSMINNRIDNMYNNLLLCQKSTIQGINQVYEESETEEVDAISFVSVKNNLVSVLNYYRSCFEDVDSIVFLDTHNHVVDTGLEHGVNKEALQELSGEIPSFGPVNNTMYSIESYDAFQTGEKEAVLTLGKRIIHIDTGVNLGYLFINVKTSTIADIFPISEENVYQKNYYIVDERGKIAVSGNPEEKLLKDADHALLTRMENNPDTSFKTEIGKEKYLVTSRKNEKFNWILVNEVRIRDILNDVYMMSTVIVVMGVICILFAVLLSLVLAGLITNPMRSLTETANRISAGNLSCRCVVDRADEVGVLAKTFNTMLERIQKLLEQIKQEQKQKRETELALFQLQIKPHFLYNTLEQIYMCCEMGENEAGGKITKALADFYRTCLSGGEEVIAIGDELKNIENYLLIQEERYSDILHYEIDAQPSCFGYKIPKMTLQPLVENAIYHGLKEKGTEGHIYIKVREMEEELVIEVTDDGVGMTQEKFHQILNQKEDRKKQHFGVKNVHERMKLYFGDKYGLTMDGDRIEGVCICIRIPKVEVYDD